MGMNSPYHQNHKSLSAALKREEYAKAEELASRDGLLVSQWATQKLREVIERELEQAS